jgi:hypothetical protein
LVVVVVVVMMVLPGVIQGKSESLLGSLVVMIIAGSTAEAVL